MATGAAVPAKVTRAPLRVVSESALAEAARAGDQRAYAELVGRYGRLVSSLVFTLTGDRIHNEDLAQDIFARAWKRLPKLRHPGQFRAYLYTIARGVCHDSRRTRARLASALPAATLAEHLASPDPSPLDRMISREEEALLWEALGRIPELYRRPLLLFYRQHKSAEAIAEALHLNVEVVCLRLSRGRKMLRQ